MTDLLQEFLAYSKDVLGLNITVQKSSAPDTFEKIFGESFLSEQEDFLSITEEFSEKTLIPDNYLSDSPISPDNNDWTLISSDLLAA